MGATCEATIGVRKSIGATDRCEHFGAQTIVYRHTIVTAAICRRYRFRPGGAHFTEYVRTRERDTFGTAFALSNNFARFGSLGALAYNVASIDGLTGLIHTEEPFRAGIRRIVAALWYTCTACQLIRRR